VSGAPRTSSRASAVAAVAVATVALAVVVTGSGEPPERASPRAAAPSAPAPAPVAELRGNLQSARCRHWRAGSEADRRTVLGALHTVVGGRTQAGVASTLSSAEATRLLDDACAPGYARGYLLYELYIRAAGFRSHLPRD
jgi:hypothetical protein